MIPVYDLTLCASGPQPIEGFSISRVHHSHSSGVVMHKIKHPHRHAGYSISLLLSGEIRQYIDFEKYTVKAPAVILLSPEQVHQHAEETANETVMLSFDKEFMLAEVQGSPMCWPCIFNKRVIPLTEAQMQEMMSYAGLIMKEYGNIQPLRESMIRTLLNALITACARLPQHNMAFMQTDTVQNRMVRHFNELSDQHFRIKAQVAHYADMMYVTPGHLNDTIKSALGKTAKQVIDEKRILEAKRLLFWGELSVKEIAWELSFEDDAYFNRFFKKHTGQTPVMFQRSIREKYN
jgi:AraC-like DNA-binding protein